MNSIKGNLRKEKSINCSGKLLNKNLIPLLKEKHYIVKDYELDGDAPKQFIKVWFYEKESGIKKLLLHHGFHLLPKLPKNGILTNL